MSTVSTVSLILLFLTSATLALAEDAGPTITLSTVLLFLVFTVSRSTATRVFKALLFFNLTYLFASLLVQVTILGSAEFLKTTLQSLKLFSLALGSISIAGFVYPALARKACSSWTLISLLIAMRSVADSHTILSDTLDAIKVNYGASRRSKLNALRTAVENVPVLVLDTVLRRFESAITMIPSPRCRQKK